MSTGFVEVPVIRSFDGGEDSPWSPREAELLAVTLELLQEHGYDRLTVDAVATSARASKATIYRRWPTKAELVLAAFVSRARGRSRSTPTRVRYAVICCDWASDLGSRHHPCEHHSCGARGGLPERRARRHDAGTVPRPAKSSHVARPRAGRRPRRDQGLRITEDLWDVLPGYLIYRLVLTGRAPSHRTIRDLVDNVLFPGLTRHNA